MSSFQQTATVLNLTAQATSPSPPPKLQFKVFQVSGSGQGNAHIGTGESTLTISNTFAVPIDGGKYDFNLHVHNGSATPLPVTVSMNLLLGTDEQVILTPTLLNLNQAGTSFNNGVTITAIPILGGYNEVEITLTWAVEEAIPAYIFWTLEKMGTSSSNPANFSSQIIQYPY